MKSPTEPSRASAAGVAVAVVVASADAAPMASAPARTTDSRPPRPAREDGDDAVSEPAAEAGHAVNGDAGPDHEAEADRGRGPEPQAEPTAVAAVRHDAIDTPEAAPAPAAADEWRPKERAPQAEERAVASATTEPPAPPPSRPEADSDADDDPDKPKRSGWWQRRSFF